MDSHGALGYNGPIAFKIQAAMDYWTSTWWKNIKKQTKFWRIPASPRRAFSTATPLSSSCLCFSSTCSSCRWMIWSEKNGAEPHQQQFSYCLQHLLRAKWLQSNQPFQKQLFLLNNTLLQKLASQSLQWQHPPHPLTSSPLILQTLWYSLICYNSKHLPQCWSERWCSSISWSPYLKF